LAVDYYKSNISEDIRLFPVGRKKCSEINIWEFVKDYMEIN